MTNGSTLDRKNPAKTKWSSEIGADDLRNRKAKLSPHRICTAPGCPTKVSPENLGTLCTKHHWRQREAGHAWHPMPSGKQRRAARRAVARYLECQSNDAGRLLTLLQAAISRKLREPVSNALKPAQIRREAHSSPPRVRARSYGRG